MHHGGFFRIFLIIAIISLLLDWYVFSGLKTFTTDWRSRTWRNAIVYGYLFISVGVTVIFMAGFGSFSRARGMTPFHEWMLSLFLTFFITKIFFVVILFVGDIGRFIYAIFH